MSETNGLNGHSKDAVTEFSWKVGLLNCHSKYMTAESFGEVNVGGSSLKKKQIWTIEHDTVNEGEIYLRSPQTLEESYIMPDKHGNVSLKEKNADCKFVVEYGSGEFSGFWSFRSVAHNSLLGSGDGDGIKCFNKGKPTKMEFWTVQLSIHPQVNIRQLRRNRYAQLCNDELQFTETIPWGAQALIILEFHKGKYALRTSDDRYLNNDGSLSEECLDTSKFTLEIHFGKEKTTRVGLAFKDHEQRYLTAIGTSATMKARNLTVSKDELFAIEDSDPQVVFISDAGKMVSVKQGMDISANQTEEAETETFQAQYLQDKSKWVIRTNGSKYWAMVNPGSGIQANSKEIKDSSLFDIQWQGDGTVGFVAQNGKYISHKSTGALVATSDTLDEKERYKVKITNRPNLILRGPHGFVGIKPNGEYVCNKAQYSLILLEGNNDGTYYMKDSNGKYWSLSDDCHVIADGDVPTAFTIEFHRQTHISIKGPNQRYIRGEQNGNFRVVAEQLGADTYWEF